MRSLFSCAFFLKEGSRILTIGLTDRIHNAKEARVSIQETRIISYYITLMHIKKFYGSIYNSKECLLKFFCKFLRNNDTHLSS